MAENQWVKMSNGQVSRQDFIFEYKRRNPQYGDVDDSILLEALFIKNPSLTTRLSPAVPGGLITAIDSTERLQAAQTIPAELVDTGFGNRVWQNFKREITFGYAGEEIPRADSLGDSIADVTGSLAGVLLPMAVPIGGTQYALGRMAMKFPRLLKMLRVGIRAEKGVKSAKQAATAEAITRGAISNVVGFNIHGQAYKHPEHTTLQDRMKETLPTTLTALAFSGAGALTYAGKTGKVLSYPAVGAIGWEMTPDDPEDPLNTTNKIVNATALMILHKGFGNREKAIQEFVDQMYPDLPAKTRTDMVDQAMTIAKTESKAKQLDLFGEAKEPMVKPTEAKIIESKKVSGVGEEGKVVDYEIKIGDEVYINEVGALGKVTELKDKSLVVFTGKKGREFSDELTYNNLFTPKTIYEKVKGIEPRESIIEPPAKPVAEPEAPAVVVPPKPSAPPPPVKPTTDFKFTDAEVEARFQAASGMQKPNLYQRIRESLSSFRQKSTREFEYLARTPENAELAFNLRKLQKQRNVADDAAVRNIQHILEGLDAKSENLFRRKVILDDLVKTAEDGKDIPFGFELESAKSELARVDAEISKYPQISDAIQRRADYWDTLRGEYVEAMQQAGMDVSERFTNKNYYRHQVLEYARVKNSVAGTGQRLKTPAGRGFLKKRKGSELDINTDYVEAEYEVMSQMFMDMEVARTIKYVDDNHNIVRQLKTGAKKKNFENLVGGKDVVRDIEHLRGEKLELQNLPEKDAAIRERLKYITEELNRLDPTSPFRQKIAIGLSKLEKDGYAILTEDGQLNFAELSRLSNEGNVSANTVFKAISERESFVRETLGENYLRWRTDIDRRVVPKEYTTWQPREGNVFYLSETIPERIVRELFEKNLEEINVPKDQIRRALTVGGKRKEFVVREEVAETLSNLMKPREENFITKFNRKMLKGWKIWALISPTRFAKYNFRNLTGDADAAFVGNPRGFGKTKQAVRELHDAFYNQKRTLEFEEWAKRGGIESTLQAQEIGNLKNLYTYLQKSKAVPEKIWKGYWRHARMSTDFRESILRYANYLDYLEQMKADSQGRPKNFGASIPGEVMALKDIRDRAFMLSNDLLGAYDRVSVTGQAIRERYIPFWSWKEVNFKRYLQLFRNAANDGELATTVGKNLLRKTTSPYTYYRVGKFAIKISAFTAMLKVWNETMFPDLEKQLSTNQRNTPHIILGQDEDGKIINFTRMGALGDFLEWFGLDAAPEYMNEYLAGRMSLAEIAQEMAKAPVNVVVQGANPFIKTPAELLMRQALFPEAFEPRVIRDRGIHIARQLGLENEYIALTGKPSRPYSEKYPHLFFYSTDPFQVSYGEIQNLKSKYMKQIGKGSVGYWISPRGDALYNMKLALRYQDTEAVKNYYIKYIRLGGTPKTLQQGLDRLDPLNGLNNKEKAHFISRLTPEEIQHLIRAYKFWQVTMMGGGTPEINNKVKNRLGIK